jgi:hypothetical protein
VPHPLMMLVCAIDAEGGPSLRSLQGRVAMLPTQLFTPSAQTASRMRSWPLCAKKSSGEIEPSRRSAQDNSPEPALSLPKELQSWVSRDKNGTKSRRDGTERTPPARPFEYFFRRMGNFR